MMKKKRNYIALKNKEEQLSNLEFNIKKNAKEWVRQNEGYKIHSKDTYQSPRISSEIPDCSMPLTFDHYNFCSLSCLYCFAYFFKSNNPAIKEHSLKAVDPNKIIKALEGNPKNKRGELLYKHFFSKEFLIHWGGMADPFCNFEKVNKIGYPIMEALGDLNYPCLFSFKGPSIRNSEYLKLFDKYKKQSNFAFQISIITNSDKMSKNIEIGVPPTSKRIETLKILSDMGYFTILRLRPFIIGISDEGLEDLLHRSLEAGIQGVSMEFFALDARANIGMKERYSWLSKFMGIDDLMKYFKDLSPSERGGYMRLNRLIKEPFVKKVYKFCIKNNLVFGCSDPDFKELCTSGSCCGMPDYYPKNPKLENWTHNQLTYHIKEMRKAYHKENGKKLITLTFNDVYPINESTSYLEDIELTNDHVAVTSMTNTERYHHSYRTILQKHWNNLNSPGNPRNYFHGKLMPFKLDEEGNLIYRYKEDEYEQIWKEEGISLIK